MEQLNEHEASSKPCIVRPKEKGENEKETPMWTVG